MSAWQPPTADVNANLGPNSPTEVRRRSLPAYLSEEQKKEAVIVMAKEHEKRDKDNVDGSASSQEQGPQLTFFQRFFCRPRSQDPEHYYEPTNRRFSLLSTGFLLCSAILVLALIVVLIAVLATELDKKHKYDEAITKHPSPIRQAILANFADPAIVTHNGTWYALATNNAAGILKQPDNRTNYDYGLSNVQYASSPDFFNWTIHDVKSDPLPQVGDWAKQGMTDIIPHTPRANVWAPSLLQRPSDGNFILFYSAAATNVSHPSHCVGAAISNTSSPAGPFTAVNSSIACPIKEGGAIDPAAFVDVDQKIYLAYKVDGNNVGNGGVCGNTAPPLVPTPIRLQKMMDDGVTPDGDYTTILDRTDEDGPLVEAPSLVRSHEGIYFLFFSSGCTRTPSYNIKYAWAKNVTGPYTRAPFPLLETGDWGLLAPGSATVASTETGGFEMAFHARIQTAFGGIRAMFTSKVEFNNTLVTLVSSDTP